MEDGFDFSLDDEPSQESEEASEAKELEYLKKRHTSLLNAVSNARSRLRIAEDNLRSFQNEQKHRLEALRGKL